MILARLLVDLPTHTGDAPCFLMELPRGATWLNGTLEWDLPEPMGLEFHAPSGDRHTTPEELQGPLSLSVERPAGGEWFVYGGPGITGAAITYTFTMTIEGFPGEGLAIQERGVC